MSKLSQAIPFCLRANRDAREHLMDWIQTPQGPVLRQVESRIQTILAENGFEHHDEAIAELQVIIDRISALYKEGQKSKVKPTSSDSADMISAMKEYIKSGDITAIVPNGSFDSAEDRKKWQRFTMADITQVNGRTIHATKTSNGRPLGFVVTAPGVTATKGKAAVLDDGTLITAVLPLDPMTADMLSKTFNSLYRS